MHPARRRTAALSAVLAALLAAGLALLGLGAQPAGAAEATWQRLNAFHSNLVATVDGGSTANNAQIVQGTFNPDWWDRQWKVIPLGYGFFKYENRYSHQCLDVQNHAVANGAWVVQNACDNSPSQRWFESHHPVLPVIHLSSGVDAGLSITVLNGGFGNGARFHLAPFDANRANQMFQRW